MHTIKDTALLPSDRLLAVVLAGVIAVLLTAVTPVPAMAASCPDVKFFGLHGTNEDGPGLPDDEYLGAGPTVWTLWQELTKRQGLPSMSFEPVRFPRTTVDLKAPGVLTEAVQAGGLESGADAAAAALSEQVSDTYVECADQTRYLLVGYSQGAWAIDKALRTGLGPGPLKSSVEKQIAGILLLGDPAWPANHPHRDRKGLATALGRGVSEPYAPDRFVNRFLSFCVSYDSGVYDPICWFDGDWRNFTKDLSSHFTYKDHPARFVDSLANMLT